MTAYSEEWSWCVGKCWVMEPEGYKLGGKKDDVWCGWLWTGVPPQAAEGHQEKEGRLKDGPVLQE